MYTTTRPRWKRTPPRFAYSGRETAHRLGSAPGCTTVMLEHWPKSAPNRVRAPSEAVEAARHGSSDQAVAKSQHDGND